MPKEFGSGSVMMHAGLVDKKTDEPKVCFYVEGADDDGWLPLDTVEIA